MKNILPGEFIFFIFLFILEGCALFPHSGAVMAKPSDRESLNSPAYHYSLGIQFSLDGKIGDAIREMEEALKLDPKSSFLATELASLYSEKGDVKKAISLCERALAQDGDIDTHLLLSSLYMNINDHKNALKEYKRVTELDPNNMDARLYMGILYVETRDFDKALAAFRTLLQLDPENLLGNYYLGKTLAETKQYREAESQLKKVLAARPLFEQGILDLGAIYEKEKKDTTALETYQNFIRLNPKSVNVRLKLANLLFRMKRTEEAEKELKEAQNLARGNKEVRYRTGLYYLENNRYDQAIEIFTALISEYPEEHRFRYLLASAYEEQKSYEKAIEELKKIPTDVDFYHNVQIGISMILKKTGRIDEAIAVLESAIKEKKGQNPSIYGALSSLYEEKKDNSKAEDAIKAGLQEFPNNTELHYGLGVLYEKTGRFEESVQAMRKVLELDTDNAEAMNFIGYIYADKGINLAEAEKLIKRALELKPGNGYMIDSLGWVYYRQEKMDLAIKYLAEAAALLPDDPTIAEHLGTAYTKSGQKEKAVETYRQALKLNPDNKTLQEKLDDLTKSKK